LGAFLAGVREIARQEQTFKYWWHRNPIEVSGIRESMKHKFSNHK
jgi:dimeric dUTPase (all-alpha-NTP-PPase superfamily)